jgi:hypothetical protein
VQTIFIRGEGADKFSLSATTAAELVVADMSADDTIGHSGAAYGLSGEPASTAQNLPSGGGVQLFGWH